MKLDFAIIIVGEICSGKTTLAELLSNEMSMPLVSFGKYLRAVYDIPGDTPVERKRLQDIGDNLIRTDPEAFLKAVIDYFSDKSKTLVFDGIRHLQIFDAVFKMAINSYSAFLDIDYETRFHRYLIRENLQDSVSSRDEFSKISHHPVEVEIGAIKNKCDILLNSSNLDQDCFRIKRFMLGKI